MEKKDERHLQTAGLERQHAIGNPDRPLKAPRRNSYRRSRSFRRRRVNLAKNHSELVPPKRDFDADNETHRFKECRRATTNRCSCRHPSYMASEQVIKTR